MLIKIYLSICLQVCNTHELKPCCGRQGVLEVQKDALLRCLARASCTSELFAALLGVQRAAGRGSEEPLPNTRHYLPALQLPDL